MPPARAFGPWTAPDVLVPAMREAATSGGVQIVRVRVDRRRAVELRGEVSRAVAVALAG